MKSLPSVKQGFAIFAEEHGVPASAIERAQVDDHFEASLMGRYRSLAIEVFLRLPDGWDSHAHWTMCAGEITHIVDVYLGGARRLKAEPGDPQLWEIRLVQQTLDRYSDAAVRWVIAHEFAHVATGLPTDPRERDDALCEDRADHLAALWGFQKEQDAFEAEKRGDA
jgi:hypothetical protein